MGKKKDIEQQSHDFERYKIQQDFFKSMDREINVDLARTFEDDIDDISYNGAHFELPEDEMEKALNEVMGNSIEEIVEEKSPLSKLRQRILRGRH